MTKKPRVVSCLHLARLLWLRCFHQAVFCLLKRKRGIVKKKKLFVFSNNFFFEIVLVFVNEMEGNSVEETWSYSRKILVKKRDRYVLDEKI